MRNSLPHPAFLESGTPSRMRTDATPLRQDKVQSWWLCLLWVTS